MVRSTTNSGWSAATQVKAVSPEIVYLQGAKGCFALKPESWQALGRRVCHGMPGSQAAAGHPTDCIGTLRLRSGQALGEPYRLHAPTSREGKAEPRRYGSRTGS